MNENKSKVAVAFCGSYDEEKVYGAVSAAVKSLGGIGSFVRPGEKILVKPNFLYPSEADKCITTNPSVIKAALRLLSEGGFSDVLWGDSPANGSCRSAAEKLGLDTGDLFGARMTDMSEEVAVKVENPMAAKTLHLTKEAAEADAIIGVCKMKTHMLERVTGAVKNMYGLICGYRKAAGHVSFPNAISFARMLADIHNTTSQRLHIMDGIVAMEGNGPASGSPVAMNVILASSDPVALDTVFCRLVHLDPLLVPTNTQGAAGGLGTFKTDEIELILSEPAERAGVQEYTARHVAMDELVEKYGNPDFDVPREKNKLNILSLWSKITGGLAERPVIDKDKCVKCGICVSHCPVEGGAVTFAKGRDKAPVYNYKKCIRCYCCQEICPQHAISVK